MRKKLSAFILLYAFWLLLTVNVEHGKLVFDLGFVIVGALLTLLVVFLTAGKYRGANGCSTPCGGSGCSSTCPTSCTCA